MPLTIRDLIDVQPITEVIDIDSFDEATVVNNYVITDEIKQHLQRIVTSIGKFERDKTNSFFAYGGYGTGKSHFLAFLYAVLTKPELFRQVGALREIAQPKTFVVKIKTGSFSESRLDNLVLDLLEKSFADKYQQQLTLSPVREYLQKFSELVTHPKFAPFLKEKGITVTWDVLAENSPEQAARLAQEFAQRINVRITTETAYPAKFKRLLDELRKQQGQEVSVVILIDELADYLDRSIAWNTSDLNISFLQELGEISQRDRVHVVATLQEELWFDAKGIDRAKWRKISDRYESFTLSGVDLKQVAGERVLRKRDRAKLESYYRQVKQRFPNIVFDAQDDRRGFVLIYPVHPLVFDAIEAMNRAGGTSRQRTALGFISEKVREMEGEPWLSFLTLDKIFDYYFAEVEVQHKLMAYHDTMLYFQSNVLPKVDREFRSVAESNVKCMLVLQLMNAEEKTAIELADIGLRALNEDGEMNQMMYQGVIQQLREKGGARYIKQVTKQGEPAYLIDVTQVGPSAVDEIENFAKSPIKEDDARIIANIREFWKEPIEASGWDMGAQGLGQAGTTLASVVANWRSRNVERAGQLMFTGQRLKPEMIQSLTNVFTTQPDVDFQLIITAQPQNVSSFIREARQFVFEPDTFTPDELFELKRAVAAEELERKNQDRPKFLDELKIEKDKIDKRVKTTLEAAYFQRGSIYNSQRVSINLLDFRDDKLRNLVETLIDEPLQEKYPEHPLFAKEYTRTHTNRLIKEFIRTGKVSSPPKALEELIRGVLIPLELADVRQPGGTTEYFVKPDLENTRYAGFILTRVRNVQRDNMEQLHKAFRSKFGLNDHFLEAILYALLRRGKIVLLRDSEVYAVTNIEESAQKPQKYDFFTEVALPQPTDKDKIARVIEALTDEKNIDPNDDERLQLGWNKVNQLKSELSQDSFSGAIAGLPQEIDHTTLEMELANAKPLFDFLDRVGPTMPTANVLHGVDPATLVEARGTLREFETLSAAKDRLENRLRYLRGVKGKENQEQAQKLRDSFKTSNLNKDLEGLEKRVDTFVRTYGDNYFDAHEKAVGGNSDFGKLEALQREVDWMNLAAFGSLKGMRVAGGWDEVSRDFNAALKRRCDKLVRTELDRESVCPHCGFDPDEGFSVAAAVTALRTRAAEALERLADKIEEETSEQQWSRLSADEQKRVKDALVRKFRGAAIDDQTLTLIQKLIGRVREVQISAQQLLDDLGVGEAMSVELLRDRFEQVLQKIPKAEKGEEVKVVIVP